MNVRARVAVSFIAAVLIWAMAVEPGPASPGAAFGLLGVLGIFAVSEQRLKLGRRRNFRG